MSKWASLATAGVCLTCVVLGACGGKSESQIVDKQSMHTAVAEEVGTALAGDSNWTVDDLKEMLIEENKEHYTIGCVYASQKAQDADDWPDAPPIAPPTGQRYWAVGTLGTQIITLYNPDSGPTNATSFKELRQGERICLVPE